MNYKIKVHNLRCDENADEYIRQLVYWEATDIIKTNKDGRSQGAS